MIICSMECGPISLRAGRELVVVIGHGIIYDRIKERDGLPLYPLGACVFIPMFVYVGWLGPTAGFTLHISINLTQHIIPPCRLYLHSVIPSLIYFSLHCSLQIVVFFGSKPINKLRFIRKNHLIVETRSTSRSSKNNTFC